MNFKCPKCGKAIPSATSGADGSRQINARFFPFCSERCRMVDLGAWLDGDYRIGAHEQLVEDSSCDED